MIRVRHLEEVMGTVFTVDAHFVETPEDHAQALVQEACRSLHQADDLFSTWRADTPISRLRSGGAEVTEMPPIIRDVLKECRRVRDLSGGWFDPWVAPGGVDPTGYVKGWAGQRLLDALKNAGAEAALVNAAGDIAGYGGPGQGRPWRLGVTDPFQPDELLGVVEFVDGALAVSGTYERGAHIYNPTDNTVATGVTSAAVIGPDLGVADALATGLMAGGSRALEHIAELADHEALVIFSDGSRESTSHFSFNSPAPGGG